MSRVDLQLQNTAAFMAFMQYVVRMTTNKRAASVLHVRPFRWRYLQHRPLLQAQRGPEPGFRIPWCQRSRRAWGALSPTIPRTIHSNRL
eukprot:COSAG06_NODE_1250_length_10106_cov_413.553113_6_plen_89_part_00